VKTFVARILMVSFALSSTAQAGPNSAIRYWQEVLDATKYARDYIDESVSPRIEMGPSQWEYVKRLEKLGEAQIAFERKRAAGASKAVVEKLRRAASAAKGKFTIASKSLIAERPFFLADPEWQKVPLRLPKGSIKVPGGVLAALAAVGLAPRAMEILSTPSDASQMISDSSKRTIITNTTGTAGTIQKTSQKAN
jgi:hypothetical protein